jgi:hypothetical protein
LALPLALTLALAACVPNTAYRLNKSTYRYHFPDDGHYFLNASAGLAFVEFNDKGQLFAPAQVASALDMIDSFISLDKKLNGARARGIVVVVFVHGWKNNASEQSGNVWGFRKALDELSCISRTRPVVGIYIGWPGVGWPGQNSGDLQDVSFSNREQVAYRVGTEPLRDTLVQIMQRTKGPDYKQPSKCILIGHSFGGLVLEHAITPVVQQVLAGAKEREPVSPPADLILFLNEAGPAQLAQPFLYYLQNQGVTYTDQNGIEYPLVLSMTSAGDAATKFAFPGGQFLSPNRPKGLGPFPKPDVFGIGSETTYYLLTTANTVALQNRQFVQRPKSVEASPKETYATVQISPTLTYDFVPKTSLNKTPYWVSQLPQVFVPDHGSVFGYQFLRLLSQLACSSQMVCDLSKQNPNLGGGCVGNAPFTPLVSPHEAPGQPAQIMLQKTTPHAVE